MNLKLDTITNIIRDHARNHNRALCFYLNIQDEYDQDYEQENDYKHQKI